MADFRSIRVEALKWFPQSRTTVPVTPVRLQTPPSPCSIARAAGRYSIHLQLAGHAVHPAFVEFLRAVEAHAVAHAAPRDPTLRWFSCLDAGLVPALRLSAFDDTRMYDAAGDACADATAMTTCACLCELAGAWTTETSWGLRWKVLEVKEAAGVRVPCFLDWDRDSSGGDSHDGDGQAV